MIPYLDSTLVLSQQRVNLVRHAHGRWVISDVDYDGFQTIRNPFNLQAEDGEANVTPLYLKIPKFIESEQTLEFMGFGRVTARLIWRKYRSTSDQRPLAEDLLWCAMQYLAYIEAQATGREGITDQEVIKERMGFHYGSATLFHIDTNCPPTTYLTYAGPRVLFWIMTIISRRYDFLYHLEQTIGSRRRIWHWSDTTYARTLDYSAAALQEGVVSWFDYVASLMKALEPVNESMEKVAVDLIAFLLESFCASI